MYLLGRDIVLVVPLSYLRPLKLQYMVKFTVKKLLQMTNKVEKAAPATLKTKLKTYEARFSIHDHIRASLSLTNYLSTTQR